VSPSLTLFFFTLPAAGGLSRQAFAPLRGVHSCAHLVDAHRGLSALRIASGSFCEVINKLLVNGRLPLASGVASATYW
jgi:hypothetical protein